MNLLGDNELDRLTVLLDASGIWGSTARRTRAQKQELLKHRYGRQFSLVLLDIINSPEIKRRFQEVMDNIMDDSALHSMIVAGLVVNVLGFDNNIPFLVELLGVDAALQAKHRNNAYIRELVHVDDASVRVRSSILGQLVLAELEQGDKVLEALVRLAQRAARVDTTRRAMHEMQIEMIKFSNVERIVPDHNKEQDLVNSTHKKFWVLHLTTVLLAAVCGSPDCLTEITRKRVYF